MKINISDVDIRFAEEILFSEVGVFDEERRNFISNLNTIDLQAVPGSGKTTALLAKLIILERYLPFKSGSGILVISHTNAAVNEIKSKIQQFCPKLFKYPNFVGTLQSFVDVFLALPFYTYKYKKKPMRIDNEVYEEKIANFSNINFNGYSLQEQNNAKRYLRVNDLYKNIRISHLNNTCELTNGYFGKVLEFNKPRGNTKPQNFYDWTTQEKGKIRSWIFCLKKKLFNDGLLCFDDAYFFGFQYLKELNLVKKFLQKRFRFVFVDEMQDMDIHQYNLLEDIFWDNGKSSSVYQRIGDKNQAIFNGDAKIIDIWKNRINPLTINGSLRLSKKNANIVKCFGLNYQEVIGYRKNHDGSTLDIKPHIIIFDDDSINSVISKFCQLIKELINTEKIPDCKGNKYYAVAWRKEHVDTDKLGLKDYFNDFSSEKQNIKIDYSYLESYLSNIDFQKNSFKYIKNNIINAIVKILRLEEYKINAVYPNSSRFLDYFSNIKPNEYKTFQLFLYLWSIDLIKDKKEIVKLSIQEYIRGLINILPEFHLTQKSTNFINCNQIQANTLHHSSNLNTQNNCFVYNDINIKIGTVHSVKGNTHTATLYLETFYQGKYESEYLMEHLIGNPFVASKKETYKKEALKMAFVGISRPTHLLSFAIHQKRVNGHEDDLINNGWKLVHVDK